MPDWSATAASQEEGSYLQIWAVARLGLLVVATFALVWAPYLGSMDSMVGVLQRLAPLKRGLFEDYVANFWCVSSLAIKWKRVLSQQVRLLVPDGPEGRCLISP